LLQLDNCLICEYVGLTPNFRQVRLAMWRAEFF
jgi:hypothetical protein